MSITLHCVKLYVILCRRHYVHSLHQMYTALFLTYIKYRRRNRLQQAATSALQDQFFVAGPSRPTSQRHTHYKHSMHHKHSILNLVRGCDCARPGPRWAAVAVPRAKVGAGMCVCGCSCRAARKSEAGMCVCVAAVAVPRESRRGDVCVCGCGCRAARKSERACVCVWLRLPCRAKVGAGIRG